MNQAFSNTKTSDERFPKTQNLFYFALNPVNLYYTTLKNDVNVLGGMPLNMINKVSLNNDQSNSLQIRTNDNVAWVLGATSLKSAESIYCKLQFILKKPDLLCDTLALNGWPDEKKDKDNASKTDDANNASAAAMQANMKIQQTKEKIQPIIMIPLRSRKCNEDWNYANGGADWDCTCIEGKNQSPIDLPSYDNSVHSMVKPSFDFPIIPYINTEGSVDGTLMENEKLKIFYDNYTVKIIHHNLGMLTTLDGSIFRAEQISFQMPSEHTIEGKEFPLEMQVVFYGVSKGDISKQAVLSFLFEQEPGAYNMFIDDLDFYNLPNSNEKEKFLKNNISLSKIFHRSDDHESSRLMDFDFYTYKGSLSFPPCSENTIRYVATQPIPLAKTAIDSFKEALLGKDEDFLNKKTNRREIQPKNGRSVYFYAAAKDEILIQQEAAPQQRQGHFELIPSNSYKVFEVEGLAPSGIEGSVVIPKAEAVGNP